jgi:hypothetical protein
MKTSIVTITPKLIEKSIAEALSKAFTGVPFHVRASVHSGFPMIAIRYAEGPAISAVFALVHQGGFAASFRFVRTTAAAVVSTTYSDMVIGWR